VFCPHYTGAFAHRNMISEIRIRVRGDILK